MDLSALKLFLEIVEKRNISQAAEACNISQPAATIKIKNLELHYGVSLFIRKQRRFELTEAGEMFRDIATKIITYEKKLDNNISFIAKRMSKCIKLGASTGPGNYILPEILSRFHEKHPDIYIEMTVGRTSEILEKVKQHHYNLAFVGSKGKQKLEYKELIYDRIILCSSGTTSYPAIITKEELLSAELFLEQKGSSSRHVLEDWLEKNEIDILSLRCIGEIGLPDALKKVIQGSRGLAFLPETLIKEELKEGRLKEIKIKDLSAVVRPLYLAFSQDMVQPNAVKIFITYLNNKYQNYQ